MLHQRIDLPLLVSSLLLLCVGSVMVYSASSAVAAEMFSGDSGFFVKRYLVRLVLGIVILVLFASLNYQKLQKWSPILLVIGMGFLALVFVPGIGVTIRGATRTVNLLSMTIQPAEGVKIALVIFLAYWLARRQDVMDRFFTGFLPVLAVIATTCLLIGLQPDYGTSIVLAATAFAVLYVGRARLLHLASAVGIMIPGLFYKLYSSAHSRGRLMTYFERFFGNPADQAQNLQGADYQLQQALIGLGTGGMFGNGLGQSRQKFLFLPDPHTDFVFAVIGEELGFLGSVAVLGLFVVFAWRGVRIARMAPDAFGFFLASGLTMLITLHVLVNIGVVTGLLPTTGLPLPFLSYGGSWLLICMMSIGILLNISRMTYRRQRLQYD